jgi:hypothetical protein
MSFINPEQLVRGIVMTTNLRVLFLLASMIAFGCATASAASQRDCLSYEPASVTLTGKVFLKVFPGRPNYETIKEGDEPEPAWLPRLAKSTCVKPDAKDEFNEAENNVSLIQLALRGKQFSRLRMLRRKGAVRFTGTLFHAQTGHHHADVLMWVMQTP